MLAVQRFCQEKNKIVPSMQKQLEISYHEFAGLYELSAADADLMQHAIDAAATAYSPYSHFRVGAALRLADGTIETASNQENVAYPSGLCAERIVLFGASARCPGVAFDTLAIVGRNREELLCAASPCGACRQVMSEYEMHLQHPLRILVYADEGKILLFEGVKSLLPFVFSF